VFVHIGKLKALVMRQLLLSANEWYQMAHCSRWLKLHCVLVPGIRCSWLQNRSYIQSAKFLVLSSLLLHWFVRDVSNRDVSNTESYQSYNHPAAWNRLPESNPQNIVPGSIQTTTQTISMMLLTLLVDWPW